jgi:hypothetical protein
MTTYNVRVSVVMLVDAISERDAIKQLQDSLRRHDFEPYASDADAFESNRGTPAEPLP